MIRRRRTISILIIRQILEILLLTFLRWKVGTRELSGPVQSYPVIPAFAGIQRLRYEETGRIAYDFDHWIPPRIKYGVAFFRGNDGNGVIRRWATQFDDTPSETECYRAKW